MADMGQLGSVDDHLLSVKLSIAGATKTRALLTQDTLAVLYKYLIIPFIYFV